MELGLQGKAVLITGGRRASHRAVLVANQKLDLISSAYPAKPQIHHRIRLSFGAAVELIEYELAPEPRGFTLRADANADSSAILKAVLTELGLNETVVKWRTA